MRSNVFVVKSGGLRKAANNQPSSYNAIATGRCLLQKFLDGLFCCANYDATQSFRDRLSFLSRKVQRGMVGLLRFRNLGIGK
jgi:hypothetical protein